MAIQKSTYFPGIIAQEMFSSVQGHSAIAKLSQNKPMPFNGTDIITFSSTDEAAVVAEGAAKPAFTGSNNVIQIRPLKFVFGQRVNDEFRYAADEVRLEYLRGFAEAFAKKIARGFDIAAMTGKDPQSAAAVLSLATNNFHDVVTNVITATAGQEDAAVQSAITALMGAGYQADGIVMTPAMASALAAIKYSGVPAFPELAWGGNPERVKGLASDITTALAFDSSTDDALVGDFTNAFKWGYAKDIPMEVIEYGDPDGAGDLKRYNQVYLRAEAYIGWAILDPNAFGIVK